MIELRPVRPVLLLVVLAWLSVLLLPLWLPATLLLLRARSRPGVAPSRRCPFNWSAPHRCCVVTGTRQIGFGAARLALLALSRRLTLPRWLAPRRRLRSPKQLAIHRLPRLVTIILAVQIALGGWCGIAIPRILALVDRERCTGRRPGTIPTIPVAMAFRPAATPVLAPARRMPSVPPAEIRGWPLVIEDRHAQHEIRDLLGLEQIPWAIVPRARVPIVAGVNPVEAVVEKKVRTRTRGIVDGIAGHRHEVRVGGQVDPAADAR